MSIIRMRMIQNYRHGDFWNVADPGYELICRDGLRDYCDVPTNVREIWACISDKQPRHNHWFQFAHGRGYYEYRSLIDFSDDELGYIDMDCDFERWLIDSPLEYRYLWFEYEDKS